MKRNLFSMIAIFLMLSMTISFIAIPTANSQTYTKQVYPYIGAVPNPAGVGQEILLHIGITDAVNYPLLGWSDLTVTVTKPDGTTQTLGPFLTDTTGGTGTVYTPTMVGTYYFQTNWPDYVTIYPARGIQQDTLMKAATSEKLAVVVQEEAIPYYPGVPLPTEYWSRPIDSQLREWSAISGSWQAIPSNLFAPYNDGPESPHVLWTKPIKTGGIVGGELDGLSHHIGDAYEGLFNEAVIMNGVLYYNRFAVSTRGGLDSQGIYAVDLHTGEELWFRNNTRLSFGQNFYWDSFNLHGAYDYLWEVSGSTWNAYDAFSGEWVYTMENVPSGTNLYGESNEICKYTINQNQGWMTFWNSTKVINPQTYGSSRDGSWGRYISGSRIYDATDGIQWNVTIPKGLPGTVRASFLNDRVVGYDFSGSKVTVWALNLKPGMEGQLLFNNSWNAPTDWVSGSQNVEWMTSSQEDYVGTLYSKETGKNYGISLTTGALIWGPTPPEYYLNALDDTKSGARAVAYSKLYSASCSGTVYCYDVNSGDLLWTYNATDPYQEILWANNWWMRPLFITDGKLYVSHYEHSPIDPRPRGGPFICLNATTGEEIFSIDGMFRSTRWGGRALIGDSIIATTDTYDMRIYAIGKGPSAIKVTAPNTGVTMGSSVLISGTITDVSPGTKDDSLMMRFPNGVPAVSDASMSDWMLYVYKQFPQQTEAVGVPVTVDVIDANGNYRNIGTITSNADGFFSFDWVPDIEGKYTVIASFAGSESYYPSHAQAAFVVDAAPQSAQQATQTQELSLAEQYFLPMSAIIIVAIVVVGLLNLLVAKKELNIAPKQSPFFFFCYFFVCFLMKIEPLSMDKIQ